MKREPVLIVMSVLTTLQLIAGSAALTETIGLQAAGLAIVVIGAMQAGVQFYVRGQVTPNAIVAAFEPEPGATLRAGEAGAVRKGLPVDVTVRTLPGTEASPYRGRDVDLRGDLGEHGQITGSLIIVIVLVSAAVAVLVYALAAAL